MGLFSAIGDVFSGLSSGAGSLLGGVVGGVGSFLGQQSANSANQHMTWNQMAFQERMRSNQYQVAVEDMKKAGLNPMLAYMKGGAGNLSGATANIQNTMQGIPQSIQSAIALAKSGTEIQQQKADANLREYQAATELYKSGQLNAASNLMEQQTKLLENSNYLQNMVIDYYKKHPDVGKTLELIKHNLGTANTVIGVGSNLIK